MRAGCRERTVAFAIDQPGCRIGEIAFRIRGSRSPFGFEEQGPTRAEALQDIVRPCARPDEFGLGRTVEIGTAEARRPLEASVLVEHDAGADQQAPGQMIGEPVGAVAIFMEC